MLSSTRLTVLEESPIEESYSSVASLEAWCAQDVKQTDDAGTSKGETVGKVKRHDTASDSIDEYLGKPNDLESLDGGFEKSSQHALNGIWKMSQLGNTGRGIGGGHRVMDSFASLGARDSCKSLQSCFSHDDDHMEEEEYWIKLDFLVLPCEQKIEMELSFLEGKMRKFYLLEKAREEQFHARSELCSNNATLQSSSRVSFSSDDLDNPHQHYDTTDANDESHGALHRRRKLAADAKSSGFVKSISMTTLLTTEALEPMDSVREDPSEDYNIDGLCVQHIVAKSIPSDPRLTETDFGFSCLRETPSVNPSWSSPSPKVKRGFQQSFKSKWQPVSRAFSRCYSWDCSSSVESSSRRMSSSPFAMIKRVVCCASSVTSDDETVRW